MTASGEDQAPDREAIERAIEVLNRVHAADPSVLPALIAHRVPCNESVADDPTVQVGVVDDGFEVGLLGIVNGLFGTDDRTIGWLAAFYDDARNLTHFGWTKPPDIGGNPNAE